MVPFKITWALWSLQDVGRVCCLMPPRVYWRKIVEGGEEEVESQSTVTYTTGTALE